MKSLLNGRVQLHAGDCLQVLPTLAENSVHSVVCDPPYHLNGISRPRADLDDYDGGKGNPFARRQASMKGFMGKQWDGGDIAFRPETWAEVLRVLKPGGHLVAFAAPKNAHRMVCAIEDAGFEIRDTLMWIFGSGFPKSLDVSKAIDKTAGAEREVIGTGRTGGGRSCMNDAPGNGRAKDYLAGDYDLSVPATDAARTWEGFGTALKPAYEPICLARKPLSEPTIAANVLRWGTGALNIDGARIPAGTDHAENCNRNSVKSHWGNGSADASVRASPQGRWPANVIHDGSEEVVGAFPESAGQQGALRGTEPSGTFSQVSAGPLTRHAFEPRGDAGSAARFFFTAKADAHDRAGSSHPTVKPLDLIQYLVRLVTPPKGTVLDCFAGTGTTGEAAWREGFAAILIEREPEYLADIERRMSLALAGPDERARESIKARLKGKPVDAGPLFAPVENPRRQVVCPECNGNPPFEKGDSGWGCETCWSHGYILVEAAEEPLFGAIA